MNNNEEKIRWLRETIDNSRYLVCLLGVGVSAQFGYTNYRAESDAYRIEERYGYSPEEMFNATFFNTRPEQFYDFYRNEMLREVGEVGEGLNILQRMEQQGKLRCIITRDIFSLSKRSGCQNVYELHGSIFHNFCPHCGRTYSMEYVRDGRGIPRCESCGTMIRPGVSLIGEMVDNALISRAAEEVQKADTLLVLGCTLKAQLTNTFLRYFEGKRLILINNEPHFADNKADLAIYGKPMDIMQKTGI